LYSCFKEQKEIIAQLLDAGQRQNKALQANKLDEINNSVRQQGVLVEKLATVGKKQLKIRKELEQKFNLSAGSRIVDIIAYAPGKSKYKINEIRKALAAEMNELREIIEINSILTEQALNINSKVLETLKPSDATTYGRTGEVKKTGKYLLDKQV